MKYLVSTALKTISMHDMLQRGDSVVVAVSGGPDSVCLLRILHNLSAEMSLKLTVAHLDHLTRNGESTEDAQFVKSLAEEMALECYIETTDVSVLKPSGVSLEEAARDFRYDFLSRVAKERGISKVALGHTANDQAETMLMRMVSGAGRRGLAGIRPVTALRGITLIRPLINVKRNEILQFLHSNDVPYRMDRTNLDRTYFRNKVRLELIPILENDYNPRVVDALLRSTAVLQEEEEYLSERAREVVERAVTRQNGFHIELSRDIYASASPVLRRRLLMYIAQRLSEKMPRLTAASIKSADELCVSGQTGSRTDISDDIQLRVQRERIIVERLSAASSRITAGEVFSIPLPGRVSLKELNIEIETRVSDRPQDVQQMIARCGPHLQFFDAEKVSGHLSARAWLPGDSFYPLGLGGRKKLSDYFTDSKYSREQREETILLLSDNDIIWIVGGAMDDRFKLTDSTSKILKVQCEQIDSAI